MVRIGHTVLGEKSTKICVPIVGTTMKEILDATAVACNTPCHVVELRIDYYERAHSIDAIIELLMLIKPQLKGRGLLFTWRTKGEGGERTISTQDYFTMLERLIPTGLVDAIDIELFFDQDRMLKTIEFAKVHGITIIMSNHDFHGTPSREVIVNRLIQHVGAVGLLGLVGHDAVSGLEHASISCRSRAWVAGLQLTYTMRFGAAFR